MQAIETKYLPATNYRGSRVKASAQAGSVTVPWDYALSVEANHDAAARTLIRKLSWFGAWVRGARVDDKGNVYVAINGDARSMRVDRYAVVRVSPRGGE